MNSRVLKILIIIISLVATMLILTTVSNAASLKIKTSKSSVSPGEKFTVTVTLSDGAGPISASVSNGSGSATEFLDNSSLTFTCTAGSSGSVSISASGTVGDYKTEKDVPVSTSKNVSIKVPTTKNESSSSSTKTPSTSSSSNTNKTPTVTKSSNSKLDSLKISEGTISPEFSSSTKEYTISVPNEITKLSVSAVADSSKATVKITGNEELVEGQNEISIKVTAEDGSTTTYKVIATRARKELNLQALSIFYINESGEKTPVELNPIFDAGVYEYTLGDISHTIDKLDIEAVASRETANIEITGNEGLVEGENVITIKVLEKDETGLEEQKKYTLKVNKQAEPVVAPVTTMEKMQNWFAGIGSIIAKNAQKIIASVLLIEAAALVGLTVYFVYDYKNYKKMIMKLAEFNKANLMEKANVAIEQNSEKETIEVENANIENIEAEAVQQETSSGRGKRFKE